MNATIGMSGYPAARLSSFYFFYYAALGAFTPYWSLYLQSRGMTVTAISVMMARFTRICLGFMASLSYSSTAPRRLRRARSRSFCRRHA